MWACVRKCEKKAGYSFLENAPARPAPGGTERFQTRFARPALFRHFQPLCTYLQPNPNLTRRIPAGARNAGKAMRSYMAWRTSIALLALAATGTPVAIHTAHPHAVQRAEVGTDVLRSRTLSARIFPHGIFTP